MSHSPGPWRWGYEPADECGPERHGDSLQGPAGALGFYDEGPDARGKSPENLANRALIAAAPRMLELLRLINQVAMLHPRGECATKLGQLLAELEKAGV